jgi:hypothetical protein
MNDAGSSEIDDVDRVLTRLERLEPPPDLIARVAQATYLADRPIRTLGTRRLWLVLDAVALLGLAAVSVLLGMELHTSAALDIAALALLPFDPNGDDQASLIEAFVAILPWTELALVAANLVVIGVCSHLALGQSRYGPRRSTRPAARTR